MGGGGAALTELMAMASAHIDNVTGTGALKPLTHGDVKGGLGKLFYTGCQGRSVLLSNNQTGV